jgi:thiol:disulfide interchange protein DsbA
MGRSSRARRSVTAMSVVSVRAWRVVALMVLGSLVAPAWSQQPTTPGQLSPEWQAPAGGWKEGVHYNVLAARPGRIEDRIEVLEFFSYGCPHCYTLEPWLVLWNRNRPVDVDFRRAHVSWRKVQLAHARLYYTLMALGREDLHDLVFDTMQRTGDLLFADDEARTLERQAAFCSDYGVDAQKFRAAHASDEVTRQVARAEELARQYKVVGTPTIVVAGRYVTDTFRAGGPYRLTLLIDHLIAIERQSAAH